MAWNDPKSAVLGDFRLYVHTQSIYDDIEMQDLYDIGLQWFGQTQRVLDKLIMGLSVVCPYQQAHNPLQIKELHHLRTNWTKFLGVLNEEGNFFLLSPPPIDQITIPIQVATAQNFV